MDWALTGATIGLIIAFCYLLDWLVSKEEEDAQKVTIIKWWSQLDDFDYGVAVRNSNIFCNAMFDKIYGKRHLSLRCLIVSICVSVFSAFALFIASFAFGIFYFLEPKLVFFVLFFSLFTNFWIDYISLIETRYILRYAAKARLLKLPALLLFDLFFSALIFLLPFISGMYLILGLKVPIREYPPLQFLQNVVTWYRFAELGSTGSYEPVFSILFYSTFSTSVIFYFYCLSTLFFKLVKLSKTRIMIVLEKLEGSDNLFKAIGGFLSALIVFVKCVVEVIQHVMQA